MSRPLSPVPTRRLALGSLLALGALASFLILAAVPHDGLHPLELITGFLPLQLAALLWGLARMR